MRCPVPKATKLPLKQCDNQLGRAGQGGQPPAPSVLLMLLGGRPLLSTSPGPCSGLGGSPSLQKPASLPMSWPGPGHPPGVVAGGAPRSPPALPPLPLPSSPLPSLPPTPSFLSPDLL